MEREWKEASADYFEGPRRQGDVAMISYCFEKGGCNNTQNNEL